MIKNNGEYCGKYCKGCKIVWACEKKKTVQTTHKLKILPKYFYAVKNGSKPFEVRRNDRNFHVGDKIVLREYSPDIGYTGREIERTISYILDESEYCKDGFIVMGICADWNEKTERNKTEDLDLTIIVEKLNEIEGRLNAIIKLDIERLKRERNCIEYGKYMTNEEVISDMKLRLGVCQTDEAVKIIHVTN